MRIYVIFLFEMVAERGYNPRTTSPKMAILKMRKCTKMAKLIHFRTESYQKYTLNRKRIQIKIPEHSISYEKVSGCICLAPAGGEVGRFKDSHFRNKKMYKNDKFDSHYGQMVLKIHIISKKA